MFAAATPPSSLSSTRGILPPTTLYRIDSIGVFGRNLMRVFIGPNRSIYTASRLANSF